VEHSALPGERREAQARVQAALRAWYVVEDDSATRLDDWLLVQERLARLDEPASPALFRRLTNEVLIAGLDELARIDAQATTILRQRYLDLRLGKEVAKGLKLSLDQVNRLQATALRQLSDILVGQEEALRETRAQALIAALPPAPYQALIGMDDQVDRAVRLLQGSDASPVVVLAGLGGLGKTALADAVARRLAHMARIAGLIWLRAPGASLSDPKPYDFDAVVHDLYAALFPDEAMASMTAVRLNRVRQVLQRQTYLVAIDNLENPEDLRNLVEHLPGLALPTRFLLTARTRPSTGAAAHTLALGELSEADAVELALDHFRRTQPDEESALVADDAAAIFAVVGGNPLALKLAVGLIAVQPLDDLLRDLRERQTPTIDDLYRHIYWRIWNALSPQAQALLLGMPLIAETGAAPEQLAAISGLADAELWPAIQELWGRSLLEVRGTVRAKRYGIHRLTETFVQTDLTHWSDRFPE